MAAPQGLVRVQRHDQTLTFQVVGWGRMKQSLPMRHCAEQGLAQGVKVVRVDLRHCTYLDSTFLGTLLFLQRATSRGRDREFDLVSPSDDCCRLFQQLGVDEAFTQVTADEPDPSVWTELPGGRDDATEFNRNIVQAHQELVNLGGTAAATFGEVVRQLSQGSGQGKTP